MQLVLFLDQSSYSSLDAKMNELDPSLFTIVCKGCSGDLVSGKNIVRVKHHHVVNDVSIRDRVTLREMSEEKKRSFLEEDYVSEFDS